MLYTKKNTDPYYKNRHSCFLLLFEADPFTCPGEFVNILKTRTSRKLRQAYGNTLLKKWYWKPYFWSDSYFIATVSENSLSTVRKYIESQGNSPTTNP